jgi:hypothetical protein
MIFEKLGRVLPADRLVRCIATYAKGQPHQQTLLQSCKAKGRGHGEDVSEGAHQVATDGMLRDVRPMDVERNHLEPVLWFCGSEKNI